jgi:ComF family protein
MPHHIVNALLSVVLAPTCAACDQPLDNPAQTVICPTCWRSIRPLTPPFCAVCSDPLPSWRDTSSERCARCRRIRGAISRGRAVGDYDGALRGILHALKYGGRRSIAPALSALMRVHGNAVLAGADVVIPVPLHWRRRWTRGFNQAAELAAGLGLPVLHALRRSRNTPSQTDLPASQRHANVRRAFGIRRGVHLTGLCVVLVDDVSTTGATLEACARILSKGGARDVRTLTAARVVTRPPPAHPR